MVYNGNPDMPAKLYNVNENTVSDLALSGENSTGNSQPLCGWVDELGNWLIMFDNA